MLPLLLLALTSQASASDLVKLTTTAGPPAMVRIEPSTSGLVLAPCRGVVWEVFDGVAQVYRPLPGPACEAAAGGVPVPVEGLELPLDASLDSGAVVRAVVVVGQGCKEDVPLELADCARLESVESTLLTIKGAAPAP